MICNRRMDGLMDRQTEDGAILICLPKFLRGHKKMRKTEQMKSEQPVPKSGQKGALSTWSEEFFKKWCHLAKKETRPLY